MDWALETMYETRVQKRVYSRGQKNRERDGCMTF